MNMVDRRFIPAFVLVAAIFFCAGTLPAQAKPDSLYKRLGGYDALAAITDDFFARMAADPQLGKFFASHSIASQKRIRQLTLDQLCEATGGPCYYIGIPMKEAHAGLNITDADWEAAVKDLTATLDKYKVPAKEKGEVLAAISGLKPDIVIGPAKKP